MAAARPLVPQPATFGAAAKAEAEQDEASDSDRALHGNHHNRAQAIGRAMSKLGPSQVRAKSEQSQSHAQHDTKRHHLNRGYASGG